VGSKTVFTHAVEGTVMKKNRDLRSKDGAHELALGIDHRETVVRDLAECLR
jgi:hypothetical protein